MNTQTLRLSSAIAAIKENIQSGKLINQLEYNEIVKGLSYKEVFGVGLYFTRILYNKFGEKKVNKTLNKNNGNLCKTHAYLELQNKKR